MEKAMEEFQLQLGRRLRASRLLRGLSQKELGDMVGVTFQQVQKYENGANTPSPARLKLLAESLGVNVGYFFGEAETALPLLFASQRKTLDVIQALHRLEHRQPAAFARLCNFIETLGE